MVCFDLKRCLSISLLTERVFEKAPFQLSPESDFCGLKEEDSPGSPPPPVPNETRGWDHGWGRAVLCLVQGNLGEECSPVDALQCYRQ